MSTARSSWILTVVVVLLGGVLAAGPATAQPAAAASPIGGGSELVVDGHRCTAGFAATDPSGSEWFLIAAGTCGVAGGAVTATDGTYVGTVFATSFPENDHTVIHVINRTSWVLVPWIGSGSDQVVLTGSAAAAAGAQVCLYGPANGWHCGLIGAWNVTVSFPWGTVSGLVRTTVCVDAGGGESPFVSGDQAQGTLVGAPSRCGSGGYSYFQPINETLVRYGLNLFTG